jgi:hypothetical protein
MYRCELEDIAWENFIHVTDTALYRDLYHMKLGKVAGADDRQIFEKEYFHQLSLLAKTKSEHFKEVAGANEFLSHCKKNNISVAIATGSWLDIALFKMNECNLGYGGIPISSSNDDFRRGEIVKSVIAKSMDWYSLSNFEKVIYFGDGL